MKIMDARCLVCNRIEEVMVESDIRIGESYIFDKCTHCESNDWLILPCAPSVSTPNNSVTTVDGSGGAARKTAFALGREASKLDTAACYELPGSKERLAINIEANRIRAQIKPEVTV